MKKIIILGTIMILVIICGFITFKKANKDNFFADNKIVNKVNKVDEKDTNDIKNGDIEENLIVEDKEEKVPENKNSSNTSKSNEKKDTSNNSSNKKEIPNNNQNNEQQKNSNSSNNDNNNQSNNNVPPKEKTAWEKLGITEDQYYNSPMISWQRVDFSVSTYGSMDKTVAACKKHGEEYVNNHDGGFSCTNVYSYSGRYLGEYFKFFELES